MNAWTSFPSNLLHPTAGAPLLTETRKRGFCPRAKALHMVMASAAAVASSSSEALETGIPVKSVTMVWKFRRDSNLQGIGGRVLVILETPS